MPWLAIWRPLGELPQLAQPRNQMCNPKEPWGFSSMGLLLTPTKNHPAEPIMLRTMRNNDKLLF